MPINRYVNNIGTVFLSAKRNSFITVSMRSILRVLIVWNTAFTARRSLLPPYEISVILSGHYAGNLRDHMCIIIPFYVINNKL